MNHRLTVGIEFYFKGEAFSSSVTIDLDEHFQAGRDVSHIYDMLAKEIGLDKYRHEYDVMVMQDLLCKSAEGIAAQYVENEQVDWQGLADAWQKEADMMVLQPIANKFFNVESLADEPKLAAALLEAYRAGQGKSEHALDSSLAKTNMDWNEVF